MTAPETSANPLISLPVTARRLVQLQRRLDLACITDWIFGAEPQPKLRLVTLDGARI